MAAQFQNWLAISKLVCNFEIAKICKLHWIHICPVLSLSYTMRQSYLPIRVASPMLDSLSSLTNICEQPFHPCFETIQALWTLCFAQCYFLIGFYSSISHTLMMLLVTLPSECSWAQFKHHFFFYFRCLWYLVFIALAFAMQYNYTALHPALDLLASSYHTFSSTSIYISLHHSTFFLAHAYLDLG